MSSNTNSGVRSAFRTSASQRLDHIETGWQAALLEPRKPRLDKLFETVRELRADSRMLGFNDVALICHKLEQMIEVAREGDVDINREFDTLGALAITFARMLVNQRDKPVSGLDLPAFIAEIDQAVNDASRQLRRREMEPPSPRDFGDPGSSQPIELADIAAPMELSRTATELFISSLQFPTAQLDDFLKIWKAHAREITATLGQGLETRVDRYHVLTQQAAVAASKTVEFRTDVDTLTLHADKAASLDRIVSQLLGNAVEHGIERSAARTVIGKRSWGLVSLTARKVEREAVIVVEDDGAGIDRSELRSVYPDVPEDELLSKVFEKGYTTRANRARAGRVGRGLSMIHDTVTRLNGTVSVHSQPSAGTRVEIRIDLPDDSIEAWVVTARGRKYALDGTLKCVQTAKDEAGELLTVVGGKPPRKSKSPPHAFAFLRDGQQLFTVLADEAPGKGTLHTLCPTPPDDDVEIMLDGEDPVIFVRVRDDFTWGSFWSES